MTAYGIDINWLPRARAILAILAVSFCLAALSTAITVNQSLAVLFALIVLTIYFYDRFSGLVAAIMLFAFKALFVRIAYALDLSLGKSGFDLLGITPALILAVMIAANLFYRYSAGERLCPDKTRVFMMLFSGVCLLSILNPANSPLIGLAGFERNIMPNMMILFLSASIITGEIEIAKLVKAMLALGIISTVYAIGQYWAVLFPWEVDWYRQIAFDEGLSGWLTIGLRGIEFRVFSIFYGYMDFFFTNVIIFGLVLAHKDILGGGWRKARILYFISWFVILGLSVERMPFIMSIIILLAYGFLKASQRKRRQIILRGIITLAIIYGSLVIAGPYLRSTGADKLIRLAELANPFSAHSIDDRMETKWGPSLETIRANPLGVGIGYGSQTKARSQAEKTGLFVQPHNELIQKTLETGFIGGLIFVFLPIYTYRDFLAIRAINSTGFGFGLGMAAVTISFWVCGLVNLPFSGTSGLVYWAMAGAALGLKDNSVSEWNAANPSHETADTTDGRVMQDATIHDATANRDILT